MRMRSFFSLVLALALTFSLCACGSGSGSAQGWQEKYDLGKKYLDEGNYQEAVVAFRAAITIDPRRAEAYSGAADAYIGQKDYDSAREILQEGYKATGDESLKTELDGINKQKEASENVVYDINGNVSRRNYFNADGSLKMYQIYSYDESGSCVRSDNYNGDGTSSGYVIYNPSFITDDGNQEQISENYSADGTLQSKSASVQSKDGKWLYSGSVDADGTVHPSSVAQYDSSGKCIGWNSYSDGTLTGYARYENGQTVYYNADGSKTMYMGN